MKYFVCLCMLDVVLTSTDEEIAKLIESGFLNVNFFVIQEESVVL